ncbi:hypothetical protein [Streptomyces sp. NPDC051677]
MASAAGIGVGGLDSEDLYISSSTAPSPASARGGRGRTLPKAAKQAR